MDEERIRMYCEQLLADIVMAKECLDCAQMIGQKIANEALFDTNFFHLSRNSFLYTGTIILCKAFEENCKEKPISILQLLAWVEITLKLKSSQKEDIANWKLQCKNDIIERLKAQRDKFYAHNDKTDLEQLEEGYGISYQEKIEIIELATQILSHTISWCNKTEVFQYTIESSCKPELEKALFQITFMNENKKYLSAYREWGRNHGKRRLELTWVGKEEEIAVEPRILFHNAEKDYGDSTANNMLIHGDNLLALRALEQEYTGKIKCIYIDPPYNTGSAFEHYDDNLEHSQWLNLIRPRLEILWNLLSNDGSIWISIDDDERDYLKILCDEVFSRKCFIASIIWQKRTSPDMRAAISDGHDYILVYAKNRDLFKEIRNKLPLTADQATAYKNPDNDPRGLWVSTDFTAQGWRPNQMYTIVTPSGKEVTPPEGRCWRHLEEVYKQLLQEGRLWFGSDGAGVPRKKTYLTESEGIAPWTWWDNKEVGHNQEAKKEIIALFGAANAFDTPKPERLIERIIHIATNPGDLVLDSFLGSGTTAAVAHKMGRRWIGIELGEHCYTHCKPRLDKVIDGEQGGISKAVNWKGGGGYKFYELAPTLIVQDKHDNPIFSEQYSPEMLVQAVAKVCGYHYAPDAKNAWKQAYCQDNSFLFVTTQYFTAAVLDEIAQELGEFEHLLVCAPAFDVGLNQRYENISVRKIPQAVLDKCKYGVDNYNLNIIDPPQIDEEEWDDAE